MAASLTYDVFISYRQQNADQTWVRQVLYPRLEEAGVRVFMDFRHFRLGEPLVTEMERGVKESRYTLAVATPAYLTSTYTEFENILAQHLGLEGSEHRLLIVMRERCDLSLRLRCKLWLDMTDDKTFEDGFARLVDTLKAPSEA